MKLTRLSIQLSRSPDCGKESLLQGTVTHLNCMMTPDIYLKLACLLMLWSSHFLWAGCIWWLPKPFSILQQLSECERVHSSIGDLASCENLPACHTKGPLQRDHWHHNYTNSSWYNKIQRTLFTITLWISRAPCWTIAIILFPQL